MPAHAPFRIAHLSDLHLTARDADRRSEPRLFGALRGMNAGFRHLANSKTLRGSDLVLVSGDITDTGSLRAWRIFRDTLAEAGLADKTLCILGNHDVCSLTLRLGHRGTFKKSDLTKAQQGLRIAGQPDQYPWARKIDSRLVVFGLDSNNSGNLSPVTNAVGRVGSRQLDRFAELLAKHRRVPVKIVMIHHSPNIPRIETAQRRGQKPFRTIARKTHQIPQTERRELRRLCQSHRVRLMIHGHLHLAEDRRLAGLRIIGAPASTEPLSTKARLPSYRIAQYTVRGKGGRLERAFVDVR